MGISKLIEVGQYTQALNDITGAYFPIVKIYRSRGLLSHLMKKNHQSCVRFIDHLEDIISNPDFVGINPIEKGNSIEVVKLYEIGVLVGIKLNYKEDYLYVSTVYEISQSKIRRRLNSGRLKRISLTNKI